MSRINSLITSSDFICIVTGKCKSLLYNKIKDVRATKLADRLITISTLYSFAQIFEKLVYSQVLTYLEKYDILNKFQFGFRKGRSTEQAIVEISDNLKKAIDNNLYTCGVFLDFAKAFDTVNHQILLKKSEAYGIRGIPLKRFTNYFFNRQQYISLNSVESSKQTMKCGQIIYTTG